ncbi:MAG: type II toxin-antitoxin system PemK/MazF family toxin [Planctomycetia bacterium]
MVALGRGSVALVPFPFSDLSQAKLRPAIVLASVGRGDWILCQVTSNAYGDERAIPIATDDFSDGGLRVASFARPGKLFTAHETLIRMQAGRLTPSAFERIRAGVVAVFA